MLLIAEPSLSAQEARIFLPPAVLDEARLREAAEGHGGSVEGHGRPAVVLDEARRRDTDETDEADEARRRGAADGEASLAAADDDAAVLSADATCDGYHERGAAELASDGSSSGAQATPSTPAAGAGGGAARGSGAMSGASWEIMGDHGRSWETTTVPQLRDELCRRGLPSLGRKAELIERLRAAVPAPPTMAADELDMDASLATSLLPLLAPAAEPAAEAATAADAAAADGAASPPALAELVQGFRLLRPPAGAASAAALVLAESASDISGRLWDSGAQLTAWLGEAAGGALGEVASEAAGEATPRLLPPSCRVVELGSGIGVAGLAAAALGHRVLLTDLAFALPLLRINADANAHRCAYQPAVAALEWGCTDDELHAALGALGAHDDVPPAAASTVPAPAAASTVPAPAASPMVLLASDVVYEPTAYEPLVHTMRRLGTLGLATSTVMAHRSRHPDEHRFFASAARHFAITRLRGPPFTPIGAPPGAPPLILDPPSGRAARDDAVAGSTIHLLRFEWLGVA